MTSCQDLGTSELLGRWHAGDRQALEKLMTKHLPWIRKRVHQRLGNALRMKLDSGDLVQDALLRFLRYGPHLQIANTENFIGLMAVIVENVIRDKDDWFHARRRDLAREEPLSQQQVLVLDGPEGEQPDVAVGRLEFTAMLRLAMECLRPDDRKLLIQRRWDGLSWEAIGQGLSISPKAAQMRHVRILRELTSIMSHLRQRNVEALLQSLS